jgi:hypothetical protein
MRVMHPHVKIRFLRVDAYVVRPQKQKQCKNININPKNRKSKP